MWTIPTLLSQYSFYAPRERPASLPNGRAASVPRLSGDIGKGAEGLRSWFQALWTTPSGLGTIPRALDLPVQGTVPALASCSQPLLTEDGLVGCTGGVIKMRGQDENKPIPKAAAGEVC